MLLKYKCAYVLSLIASTTLAGEIKHDITAQHKKLSTQAQVKQDINSKQIVHLNTPLRDKAWQNDKITTLLFPGVTKKAQTHVCCQ